MNHLAPVILIVTDRKAVTSGAWSGIENDALPHTYVHAIEQAGGIPVLLPPTESVLQNVGRLLDSADGVFLAGGRDIDAGLYEQENHPLNDAPLRIRDQVEIGLALGAGKRGMPVFGACRGMQVLNTAFGGTLVQHLADHVDMTPHRDKVGVFTSHHVEVLESTLLAQVVESKDFYIDSHHHQAIDKLGVGFIASAYAPDGVIEAIEAPAKNFMLGVQWHPEESLAPEGLRLVDAFITAARSYTADTALVENVI